MDEQQQTQQDHVVDMKNESPATEPQSKRPPLRDPEEKGIGAVLGAIIVVTILVIAAFYVWGNGQSNRASAPVVEPSPTEGSPAPSPTSTSETATDSDPILDPNAPDPVAESLSEVNPSDDLQTIESELNDTSLDSLDSDLNAIEQELAI